MEWGETLGQLDHTVTVPEAVARWGGDLGTIQRVNEGVNVVFRFEADGEGCYLRLTHESLMSERRVASAFDYLSHLAHEGAPVCKPIESQFGRRVEALPQADGLWLATVTGEVPGSPLGLDQTERSVYEAWGRSLGMLHRAAETYQPGQGCEFEQGSDIWTRVRPAIKPYDALAQKEHHHLSAWYRTLPAASNSTDFGLTHADCNPRNFLWDGRRVTAIDFDEPAWNWFAVDIARALLEFMEREQRVQFRQWFLRGYRSARDFSDFWESSLTGFMRMIALDMYAWNNPYATPDELKAADREDTPGAGDFCGCLRKRFADPSLWA